MIEGNWERWKERKDLLDYVIGKGAVVTVRFIQNVDVQNGMYLLHSLIKEKG